MDYAQILMKSAGKSDYRESSLQTLMKVNDLKKTINKDGRANIIKKEPYANKIETYLSNEELKRKLDEGSRQYLRGVYQYYGDLGLKNLGLTNKTADQQEYIKLARKQTQYLKLLNNPNQLEYLSKVDPLGLFTLQQVEQKNLQDLQAATADPTGEILYNFLRGNRVQAVGQPNVDAISDSDSFSLPPREPLLVQLSENQRAALARFADSGPSGQPSESGTSTYRSTDYPVDPSSTSSEASGTSTSSSRMFYPIGQSRAPSEASGETIDLGDVHPQDRELVQDVQNQVANENEQLAQPQVDQIAQQAYQNALAEANGAPVAGQEQVPAQPNIEDDPEYNRDLENLNEKAINYGISLIKSDPKGTEAQKKKLEQEFELKFRTDPSFAENVRLEYLQTVPGLPDDDKYLEQSIEYIGKPIGQPINTPSEYPPTPFTSIPSGRILSSMQEDSLKRLLYQFSVPFNDSDSRAQLIKKLRAFKKKEGEEEKQREREREEAEAERAARAREREREEAEAERAARDEENIRRFGLKEVEYSPDDDDDTVFAKSTHNNHMRALARVAKGENITQEDISAPAQAQAQAREQRERERLEALALARVEALEAPAAQAPKLSVRELRDLARSKNVAGIKPNDTEIKIRKKAKDQGIDLGQVFKKRKTSKKSGKGFKPLSSFPPHIVGGLLRKHINRLIPKTINRNEYNRENAHKLLNSVLKK